MLIPFLILSFIGFIPFGFSEWKPVQPGIQYSVKEVSKSDSGMSGVGKIHITKFDPTKWSIRPYFFEEFTNQVPGCGLKEWSESLKSSVVINGGQYEVDLSYIGILQRLGKKIGRQKKISWKAYLVSDPKKSEAHLPPVDILDGLRPIDMKKLGKYQTVAQTFMLFDERRKIRVQHSGLIAERTLIGIGKDKWIYVLVTEGSVGLWEIADWLLKRSDLRLIKALSLDGADKSAMKIGSVVTIRGESSEGGCALPSVLGLFPK